MDQEWCWLHFGQRKAKLTALQKIMTRKVKDANADKKRPLNKCKKARSKCEKEAVTTKKTSVNISSAKIKSLKKKSGQDFSKKHSQAHVNDLFKKRKREMKNLNSETEVVGAGKPCGPRRVLFRPSDIPRLPQLRRLVMRRNQNPGKEVGCRHRWSDGHMLWGKIGRYPFWPCMVSRDPFSKLFTKETGSYKTSRSFHVQFFGANAERSWIHEASLLEYEGRIKFMEIAQYGLDNPEISSRSPEEFKISPEWFPAWSLALAEAEAAFKLSLEARMERYTFQYVLVKGKAQKPVEELLKMVASKEKDHLNQKNGKLEDNVINIYNEVFSTRSDRPLYDSDDFYSSDDSLPASDARPGKRRVKIVVRKGSLDVFLAKHSQFVQREHPDWKKSWIVEDLTRQWSQMSELQKNRYTTRLTKRADARKYKKQVPETVVDEVDDEIDPHELDLQITKLSKTCSLVKAGEVCFVCEGQGSNLVRCEGLCGKYCHRLCVQGDGSDNLCVQGDGRDKFMCSECSTGYSFCFVCKKPGHDVVQCSGKCTKFYHKMCARDFKLAIQDKDGIICPLHTCATCAADGHPGASTGPFLECVRCPTAYHASDLCVGAGSKVLAKGRLVCAGHFNPNKRNSQHSRVNVKHCLECGRGGSLLLCQTCPAAYHEDCAAQTSDAANSKQPALDSPGSLSSASKAWLCPHCLAGRKLLYGDVVWVKHGIYRWWPSEVCHPFLVPKNVQEKRNQIGEFPVRFFGSHDFAWVHEGRVISFDRGTSSFRNSLMTSADKVFKQAAREASAAARFYATVERTM